MLEVLPSWAAQELARRPVPICQRRTVSGVSRFWLHPMEAPAAEGEALFRHPETVRPGAIMAGAVAEVPLPSMEPRQVQAETEAPASLSS